MAAGDNSELVDAFLDFYRTYYRDEIGKLAQNYPTDQRSLYIDYDDLYRFDPDLADDYENQPEQLQKYAEEALRLYDLPVDVKLGQAHVRMAPLPDSTDIRAIRARHVNTLVTVRGTVNKATDVRPKMQEAAFECQRCGTLTRIPQSGGDFQEPHECQGCERQGPFGLNYDQSEFVDSQKLRVQESPEGLRGGETPQAIDIQIEDDITGKVTPGDHVAATGILRLEQQGSEQDKSAVFDVYMDGISVVIDEEDFEDMEITDADKEAIYELSNNPDIYDKMVASVAPSIYGYDEEKLSMILQLFSGVTKHLPDGSRIRGDLHMLLIGDPGTGKCVAGDTNLTLGDGNEREIRDLVESNLDDPKPVDDGVWDHADFDVPSLHPDGTIATASATKVWKREAPEEMYRIRTASGREIDVTPSHPLFVQGNTGFEAVQAKQLGEGEFVAVPSKLDVGGDDTLDVAYRESKAPNAVRLNLPDEWTPWLAHLVGYLTAEGYVEYRDDNTAFVSVTNNDEEVLDAVADSLERLGLNYSERQSREEKTAREILCCAGEFASFLENLEPTLLEGSASKTVPDAIFRASRSTQRAFLQAFIEGEGHVTSTQREITVASMNRDLLEGVRRLLLRFGIQSQLHPRNNGSHRLRISGVEATKYVREIGFLTDRKQSVGDEYESGSGNTNRDVVPNVGAVCRRVREGLGLAQYDCGLPRSTYQHYERGDRNPSRESLLAVVESFESALVEQPDPAPAGQVTDGGSLKATISALRRLAEGDVTWDHIESIDAYEPEDEWVYDLEVAGTHTYVSNGVISHNSQLLSYIKNVAPRSVYTSGKGSSSAGLCVTGDTRIQTGDGLVPVRELALEEHPAPVDEDTSAEKSVPLQTFDYTTTEMVEGESSHVWRMPEKPCRRVETAHGKSLEASVNTPVLTCGCDGLEWVPVSEVEPGEYVAVPKYGDLDRAEVAVRDFLELTTEKVKLADESVEELRTALSEEFGHLRAAAGELGLSEDFVYDSVRNRHVPLGKLDAMLDAVGMTREDVEFDRLMIRHGDSVTVPETFDEDLMYLLGLVFGDGDISLDRRDGNRGMVRISNGEESVLKRAAEIFAAKFDKHPEIERQDDRVPCIRVNSATIARLFANAGMETPKVDLELASELTTAAHADAFLRGLMDADGAVSARDDGGSSILMSTISEDLAEQVQLMLETYGVRARRRERDRRGTYELADGRTIESKHVQHFVELYGSDVERYADAIGFEIPEKQAALDEIVDDATRRGEKLPVGDVLVAADGGAVAGDYHMNVERGDNPSRERAGAMLKDIDVGDAERAVREAVDADLRWDRVTDVEDVGEKEVFDLTVPETHNFVGNGVVTHNTAAAVRDDFGDGQQWSLEAGALVLADRGIAAVDELDKMAPDDRSAMHQALEQQEISVSKAGINATLKSRCSLLGAANPKYGRFDQYEPIGEQIDLEPALISRFDLIFTVTDQPDEEEDRNLASHILNTNYAGELETQRTEMTNVDVTSEEIDDVTSDVDPDIDPELMRKYIAYAKQNCHPRMTDGAKQAIEDFYVDLRSKGQDEDSPVPVTARQLEAIVRLAEASARVRLSDTVDDEDADRVIDIVRSCLQDIGVDPETGEFDADVVETGQSKTQRDRIKNLKGLISDIEEEYDDGAPVDVVMDRADEIGMDASKAEHEIEKLKQKGEVYEPKHEHLRTT